MSRTARERLPAQPGSAAESGPGLSARISRYTYRHHLLGESLEGLFKGAFLTYEVVARKGLGASDLEITLLTTASSSFLIFSSFWAFRMENRSKKRFMIGSAVLGRGALLLVALTSQSLPFIFFCCAVFMADAAFIPAQTAIFQANYDARSRGTYIGRVLLRSRWIFIASAFAAGHLLERYPGSYRILFPVSAILGILAYLRFARIRIRHGRTVSAPLSSRGTVGRFLEILRENPAFDRYERNFFIYGIAFLMLQPVTVFLLVDHFRVDYDEFSNLRLVLFHGAVLLTAPLAGWAFDRFQPLRATGVTFAVLILHPLTMGLAYWLHGMPLLAVSFVLFGIGMSGVAISWPLGSLYFSGPGRDAAPFTGVHVTAVGIRGLFAPFLGYASYRVLGFGPTFAMAAGLFLTASILMFRQAKHPLWMIDKIKDGKPVPL